MKRYKNICRIIPKTMATAVAMAGLLVAPVVAAETTTGTSNNQQLSTTKRYYAAVGDSVAAGLGLPRAADSDPACGVSNKAYAARVAAARNLQYFNDACSGATVGDLVTEQHLPRTSRDIEPQLDRVFARGSPAVITLTAGANDVHWQTFLRKCYVARCGTKADKFIANGLFIALRVKLEYALQSIEDRSKGLAPQIVLTGYYQPLSMDCSRTQTRLISSEISWLRGQTARINRTLIAASKQYPNVRYAPIDFSGHDLCSNDSWIQGLNAAAPFHPTVRGQQAIARAVLTQLR